MVSRAHRFLRGRTPSTAEPVWHLTGNTDDIFFHDAYLGCLSLTDTIRHWALEQDPEALVVVLTAEGELIPEANALTDLLHSRRKPRAPRRIPTKTSEGAPASQPPDRTAESTTENLYSRTGSRRYADQLAFLSSVFSRPRSHSIIAIVFGLPEQFERAASEIEKSFELRKAVRALVQHAQENIGSLLFLVDPRTELSVHLLQSHSSITIDIPTPAPEEIEVALARVSLRHDITMRHTKSIARYLATNGNLQSALRRIASLARDTQSIGVDTLLHLPEPDEVRVTSIFQELDSLVGLKNVKNYFHKLPNIARRHRIELRKHGRLPESTMHMVFKGSAGTGKTSVARIVARLFHALGILHTDAVIEILPTELASKHANEITERMQNSLMKGRGGVIFIDEAHQLMGNTHSEESIKALVTFAENHRNDTVIILAGYTELIDTLMRVDEGLKRRFPTNLIFHDYNSEELCQVVHDMARADGFTMSEDARAPLMRLLEDRRLDADFGNAGGARNIWQQIRSIHNSKHDTTTNIIEITDIPATITVDNTRVAQAEKVLAGYIGSHDLHEFLRNQRILLASYRNSNQPRPWVDGICFVGPPGTGKTSIAKYVIAPYLYGIGLLDRPTAKLVTVDDIQTSFDSRAVERVKELFHAARGGVLVIEKVGSLPADNIYGIEAIRALATEAANPENRRTLIILEGHEEEVDSLISRHPGLEGRFNEKIVFDSMSAKSLLKIMRICAQTDRCQLSKDFEQRLLTVAPIAREVAGRNFGNARWAMDIYKQAKENMIVRTSSSSENASPVDNTCLIGPDLVAALRNEDPRLSGLLGPVPSASPETAPPAPLGAITDSECITRLRNAILPIVVARDDYQDIGTGFLVAASGLVATAAHVLQDAVRVTIGLGNIEAKIIAVDEETDTALLHLPAEAVSGYEPLPLGQSRNVRTLSELLTAGYQSNWEPGDEPYALQVQVSRNMWDKSSFEVGGNLDRGASGGPLIDPSQGAVIGLVSGGVGSTIKVIARIEQLRQLLEEQGHGNKQYEHGAVGTDPERGV